ncbi:MAG TPA: hypothetical protein VGB03_00565, partial [Acidimicrobiales bacterium]
MHTEWPAPAPEADVLAYVHHRARALGVRRRVVRTVPAVFAMIVLAASLLVGDDGRHDSLRVADDGATAEAGDEGGASPGNEPRDHDGGAHGDEDEDPPQFSVTPRPVSDDPVELRSPKGLPLVPQPDPPTPGPHLVDDPEGDDSPNHDAVDLRYGDIAHDRGRDSLRFTVGVTDLSDVPVGVSYSFTFYYDDLSYGVAVLRRESAPTPVVYVNSQACPSCPVAFDAKADEVRIDVPLSFLNERIAHDSTATWSPAWPQGHRQSPPL